MESKNNEPQESKGNGLVTIPIKEDLNLIIVLPGGSIEEINSEAVILNVDSKEKEDTDKHIVWKLNLNQIQQKEQSNIQIYLVSNAAERPAFTSRMIDKSKKIESAGIPVIQIFREKGRSARISIGGKKLICIGPVYYLGKYSKNEYAVIISDSEGNLISKEEYKVDKTTEIHHDEI